MNNTSVFSVRPLYLTVIALCLTLTSCYTLYPAPAPSGSTTTAPAQPSGNTAPATPPEPPPLTGTPVPGDTLTEKLAWLQRSADSHNTYILEVNADENIAPTTLQFSGAINVTIGLRGDDENRTIRLRSNGTMFTVNSNVTLVLENNITLMGYPQNTESLVLVNGGTLRLRTGSTITGNASREGGGIFFRSGTFEMSGGSISGNSANNGGGVYVSLAPVSSFTMSGGEISGNSAINGGGMYMSSANFTMSGGTISGNTATNGGGVYVHNIGTFAMRGGTISSNSAISRGGGVNVDSTANFIKTGGIITGYNSNSSNGNAVKDEGGNVIARMGHAVSFAHGNGSIIHRKETTVGPGVNLSTSSSAGWDS